MDSAEFIPKRTTCPKVCIINMDTVVEYTVPILTDDTKEELIATVFEDRITNKLKLF